MRPVAAAPNHYLFLVTLYVFFLYNYKNYKSKLATYVPYTSSFSCVPFTLSFFHVPSTYKFWVPSTFFAYPLPAPGPVFGFALQIPV